jgi:NADH-quinone oxidoreductase subunit N
MINQVIMVTPEIFLTSLALLLQVMAVFMKGSSSRLAYFGCLLGCGIIFYLLYAAPQDDLIFSGSFAAFKALYLLKAIILTLSLMTILMYRDLNAIYKRKLKMEFITLILLSTLGSFVAISARDCLLLFCGLELQSLSAYALAGFNIKDIKSSEAALKYFILGALMSALMLLGISFLYGFSGSIRFLEIKSVMTNEVNIGLVIGAILLLAPIFFKLSAAPLHVWTPDVYEGAPMPAVAYFATSQKLTAIIVLITLLDNIVGDYYIISNGLVKTIAILSMLIGAFGAIMQHSLKRLMAYSSILNIGYALIGISLYSLEGKDSAFLYILIYVISVLGFFACLIALLGDKSEHATFDDIKGIASRRKTLAGAMTVFMFSMIGLPPMAGFFGKYYIFYNAILTEEIGLAVIGILTSVVAAFYYLKVIKYIYFMPKNPDAIVIRTQRGLMFITILALVFILFFCIFANNYMS